MVLTRVQYVAALSVTCPLCVTQGENKGNCIVCIPSPLHGVANQYLAIKHNGGVEEVKVKAEVERSPQKGAG